MFICVWQCRFVGGVVAVVVVVEVWFVHVCGCSNLFLALHFFRLFSQDAVAEIEAIKKRVTNQEAKMKSLVSACLCL